jgi:hypothetical protein
MIGPHRPTGKEFMKRLIWLALVAVLVPSVELPSGSAAAAARAAEAPRARVVIYGDSLTEESRSYIEATFDLAKVDLVWHVFGGTALCNWLPSMATEAAAPTTAVVVEFAGNSFDGDVCMNDPVTGHAWPVGSAGWLGRYSEDARAAQALWTRAHVPVFWVQLPPLPTMVVGSTLATYPLNVLYAGLGGELVPAGAAVADAGGGFTFWRPCLPAEPCGVGRTVPPPPGQNQVRNADQVHFCPLAGPSAGCGYSPGAARFGAAVGTTVATRLGLGRARGFPGRRWGWWRRQS